MLEFSNSWNDQTGTWKSKLESLVYYIWKITFISTSDGIGYLNLDRLHNGIKRSDILNVKIRLLCLINTINQYTEKLDTSWALCILWYFVDCRWCMDSRLWGHSQSTHWGPRKNSAKSPGTKRKCTHSPC